MRQLAYPRKPPSSELALEHFEVVSIKPCVPRELPAGVVAITVNERAVQGTVRVLAGGARLQMSCGTVLALLRYAYPTMSGDVSGGADLIDVNYFCRSLITTKPSSVACNRL